MSVVPIMSSPLDRQRASERFEKVTGPVLVVLALATLPLLITSIAVRPEGKVGEIIVFIDWAIAAIFAFDYLVRLSLATERWRFVRREWPSLLIVAVPFIRVLRGLEVFRVLEAARVTAFLVAIHHKARHAITRYRLHYAVGATVAVLFTAAGLVTELERHTESPINNFGDGLWWAITTVTTVGYGDMYPVTGAGRALAALLMFTGIALFSFVIANISATLERGEFENERQQNDGIAKQLDEVLARMATLEQLLERSGDNDASSTGSSST